MAKLAQISSSGYSCNYPSGIDAPATLRVVRTLDFGARRRLKLLFAYCAVQKTYIVALLAISCYTSSILAAQNAVIQDARSNHPAIQSITESEAEVPLPDESVNSGDLLRLTVRDCPELSRSFRVSSEGTLVLPLVGNAIAVRGLTAPQIEKLIEEILRSKSILNDPVVIIAVLEYRSRPVNVVGAVNHPLTFQATGDLTLLDAIARAGGMSPTAGSSILVSSRVRGADGRTQVTTVTIASSNLLSSSNTESNLHLRGGEQIRVLEAGKVFVSGNVRHPGMLPMQNDADMTVLKAIAMCEGLQSYSAKFAYIYRQNVVGQQRQEVQVPLSRIMQRKDVDVALMRDDILYVPENGKKKMTGKVFGQIAGFAQSTGSGILILH